VAHGLDEVNTFTRKVTPDGRPLEGSWFRHKEIKEGGKLEFFMGPVPNNDWEKELPPESCN
jgi:putative alpha-1,2-mannosidase